MENLLDFVDDSGHAEVKAGRADEWGLYEMDVCRGVLQEWEVF